MAKLIVKSVLLAYEEPLVIIAVDTKDKPFIGVNYADGDDAYLFYFARISTSTLTQLVRQKVDVRYAVTKLKLGLYQFGELWGALEEEVDVRPRKDFSLSMLPQSGMFIPEGLWSARSTNVKNVHIDGRWGIEDLRRFSDLVQDAYAFVYALSGKGSGSTKQQMSMLFRKYPWRGGFSSVNFFDDLYKLIPESERAEVKRITYASPGTIELRMDSEVADSIRCFVEGINMADSTSSRVYTETRDWLRSKGWLGRAKDDIEILAQDTSRLMGYVSLLSRSFGLAAHEQEILSFANSDPLGAVKILLAYYRRLAGLADYVATGKAQQLFT